MPNKISINLVPHTLRLRQRNQKEFLLLDDLPLAPHKFSDLFQGFLNEILANPKQDEDEETMFEVATMNVQVEGTATQISGIVRAGQYGIEAELKNVVTKKSLRRSKDHCELLPFFFFLELRSGQNEAIFLMQRFGIHGAQSQMEGALRDYLATEELPYTVLTNQLVSERLMAEALGGGLKKIRYIKTKAIKDEADNLGLSDNRELIGRIEVAVSAVRDGAIPIPDWLRRYIDASDPDDLIEVDGQRFDDIKFEMDVKGKRKTLRVQDMAAHFRASYDITGDVDILSTHPTYDSLVREAKKYLPELRKSLHWE